MVQEGIYLKMPMCISSCSRTVCGPFLSSHWPMIHLWHILDFHVDVFLHKITLKAECGDSCLSSPQEGRLPWLQDQSVPQGEILEMTLQQCTGLLLILLNSCIIFHHVLYHMALTWSMGEYFVSFSYYNYFNYNLLLNLNFLNCLWGLCAQVGLLDQRHTYDCFCWA